MRLFSLFVGMILLGGSANALEPNNITVNCFFDAKVNKGTFIPKGCHAVANLHFQGEADHHLSVNCPGLGTATKVYNDEAEFFTDGEIVIEPAGETAFPSITLPGDAFDCRQTPESFDAELVLPDVEPYDGAELDGSCMVVTAGCDR